MCVSGKTFARKLTAAAAPPPRVSHAATKGSRHAEQCWSKAATDGDTSPPLPPPPASGRPRELEAIGAAAAAAAAAPPGSTDFSTVDSRASKESSRAWSWLVAIVDVVVVAVASRSRFFRFVPGLLPAAVDVGVARVLIVGQNSIFRPRKTAKCKKKKTCLIFDGFSWRLAGFKLLLCLARAAVMGGRVACARAVNCKRHKITHPPIDFQSSSIPQQG